MGGVNLAGNSPPSGSDIVSKLGYETTATGDATVPAQGAGSGGECTIATDSGNATITCTSDDAPQDVTVTVDPEEDENNDVVTTSFGSS
jgi:hypothetical protein